MPRILGAAGLQQNDVPRTACSARSMPRRRYGARTPGCGTLSADPMAIWASHPSRSSTGARPSTSNTSRPATAAGTAHHSIHWSEPCPASAAASERQQASRRVRPASASPPSGSTTRALTLRSGA